MTTFSSAADKVLPVFDGHVDLVYALQQPGAPSLADGPLAPHRLAAGGVCLFNSALYCADATNGPSAAAHLAALLEADERLLCGLPLVRNRADLDVAWRGIGAPARLRLLENADALLEFGVARACAAGIVTVGLTHVGRNRLADGDAVASPGGLTPDGRCLLNELAAAGRVLDVAHLAAPGFWQVLEAYPGPVVCTHTGLRRYCDRPRNLADEQVRALLEYGGVVGLAFAPGLLAGAAEIDLEAVFRQIDWLVQSHGAERIAVGSDFGGFEGTCVGLEEPARLPALVARLRRAGYPEAAASGIMGENWRRFYAAVLPE